MSLWTPPGADLGEPDEPRPDSRTSNFYMIDRDGRPQPVTFRRLRVFGREHLRITTTTPDGPAALLHTSREMLAHGVYQYEFVTASASWSIFAVEAALKLRIGRQTNFQTLIRLAMEQGYWEGDVGDILEAGRKIRNDFVHEGKQPVWTFGLARSVIGASFRLVRELYPE